MTAKDWRGTPINIGAFVLYGAPVGRSIAMVEGTVDSFTQSGRVNIRVVRRAYGSYGDMKPVVHVGADRLTVLAGPLPPTDLPTEAEKAIAHRMKTRQFHVDRIAALEAGEEPKNQWDTLDRHRERLAELA